MKDYVRKQKRIIKKCVVTLFVMIFLAGSLVLPVKASQKERKIVRIGYYPVTEYQDKDQNGNYYGFSYDYYVQIQKYTGWEYEYVEASYAECMDMLAAGEIDIVSGVVPTDDRRKIMNFSNYSISNTQNKLYARNDDTDMFYESFDQFDGATVAVMAGTLLDELTQYAALHDFSMNVREYDSLADMKNALLSGEVRLVYGTSMAEMTKTKIVARLDKILLYYAVAKNAPEVQQELDIALHKIIDNNPNFYMEMSQKYMVSGANAIATFTKEEYDYIHSGETVYVIMNDNWAPICWYDQKSKSYRGILTGMIDKISEYSGLEFVLCNETTFNAIAEENPEALNNVLAVLADDSVWASQQTVMMTNRILDASVVMVSKKGLGNMDSVDQLRFALPERYYVSWKAAELVSAENITYYSTIEECMDAINDGKADATYANEMVASYYLSMLQYSDLFATSSSDFDENLAFAINQDTDQPLLGILDKAILCVSDDEINQLVIENSIAEQRVTLRGLFYSNPVEFAVVVLFIMFFIAAVFIITILMITKRRRLAAQLVMEQENAAARTEFFMMISHELRTPLNAIVGYLEIALNLCQRGDVQREYLKRSQNAARQLTAVAQDMLDYTNIASSKASVHPVVFDLKSVVHHIGENTSIAARKQNVHFQLNIQNIEYEFVIGDEQHITQIMQNILSNSVKFTATGGQVEAEITEIISEENHMEICFRARDTGKGMSREFLEKVCAPFNQSDPAYSRTHGGLGLGLYLTKFYLDAMGGRMEVESELDKGSCFTVYIPVEKAESETLTSQKIDYSHVRALVCGSNQEENKSLKDLLKRLQIKSDISLDTENALRRVESRLSTNYAYSLCVVDEQAVEENQHFLKSLYELTPEITVFVMSNGEKQLNISEYQRCQILSKPIFQSVIFDAVMTSFGAYEPKEKQQLPSFTGVHAMIAEDNDVNADILVRMLGRMNVTATVFDNGQLAVQAYEQEPENTFDIIFMDIQMPVMDGYEAARKIRAGQKGREIPIIAVSANAFPEDIENSKKAGMNEHLSKPVDVVLLGKIMTCFLSEK